MGGRSMSQDVPEIEDARLIVSDKNDLQLGAIEPPVLLCEFI